MNQTTGALTLASSLFFGPAAWTVTTVPNAMSSTATVTGLQIAPSSAQIHTSTLGKQSQFTLAATFSDGSTGFLTGSATWTSSNTSVATVASGLATSTGYGTTTITATVGGQSATASLTVAEPTLVSITVPPATVTVYQGTAIQLTATGEYADGTSIDLTNSVTWSSSNTSAATVSTGGLVQSVGLGTATITATQVVIGTGTITVVAPFAWRAPAAITYGTPLSAAQLDATSRVTGTYVYTPPAGTVLQAGTHLLTVVFTPDRGNSAIGPSTRTALKAGCHPSIAGSGPSLAATASVNLTVNKAVPAIKWPTPAAIPYGTALGVAQLNASSAAAGTFSYSSAAGTVLGAGTHTITATFTPTDTTDYGGAVVSVQLVVNQAAPKITWVNPAPITYGTALGSVQLNASSSVTGAFGYSLAAGTVLGAGSHTITATFTPIDATDYEGATSKVTLVFNQAAQTISWATPAAISYGTALSATQPDAISPVAQIDYSMQAKSPGYLG